MLQKKHFEKDSGFYFLKETGKKTFVREWDEKLQTTIKHRKLKKHVSYAHLVKLECYKLIKDIMQTGQEYEPFKLWW